MKAEIAFIKLGGGLITDKNRPLSVKAGVIKRLAQEIREIQVSYPALKLIIGNGAGSFGHYYVRRYNLAGGARSVKQIFGTGVVQHSVRELNNLVTEQLLAAGVPAFSVSVASMVTCAGGKITKVFTDPIAGLLHLGAAPVVYGDLVTDTKKGAVVLSTEEIFALLIDELKTKYEIRTVIYAADVAGVLDKDGKVISHLSTAAMADLKKASGFDVTGGMQTKLAAALAAARQAQRVYILGANQRGNLLKAIAGQAVGTQVVAS